PVDLSDFDAPAAVAAAFVLRYVGQASVTVGIAPRCGVDSIPSPWFATVVPVTVSVDAGDSVSDALATISADITVARSRGPYLRDLPLRMPLQVEGPVPGSGHDIEVLSEGAASHAALQIVVASDASSLSVRCRGDGKADRVAAGLAAFVAASADPDAALVALPVVGEAEAAELLALGREPNRAAFRGALHQQFLAAAASAPDRVAVVHRGQEITYAELEQRARRVAGALENRGVRVGGFVGVSSAPSVEMLVAVLGVLMSGCAYVPLDPRFPADRLSFMVDDANMELVLTDGSVALASDLVTLDISRVSTNESIAPRQDLPEVDESALAYMMYTSGSTGLPKGVMVEHGNVDSFLQAMEPHLGSDDGVWLSVTTLSFDISVLELFYPLVQGWKVVLYEGLAAMAPAATSERAETRLDVSLFFFGSEGVEGGRSYDVLFEAARYGDTHGFAAVWTPERHFHAFGGPFPNPAVTGAALAAVTEKIGIRSGSCVVPLHHPVRVAEEWAVVDQISGGRVGLSVAAGWHPNDFILRPENYRQPKTQLMEQVEQVRSLWRGETLTFEGPTGDVDVLTLPRPVQPELPVWYTTAGNVESFELAGRQGLFLLTHLLGQSVEQLAEKVAAYRAAWNEAGHEGRGVVSLMLHTFVTEDSDIVRETVREPMKSYLRDAIGLVKEHASAFPTFDPTMTATDESVAGLSPEDLDALLEVSFARYFETSGLFGSVPDAIDFAEKVAAIGVDEIAA
ncbi:MAG: MupA/Atu3671 family FMN-dependent luciferase-like monooxygenase, partial [Acidimicrobiales bacterium]